MDNYDDNFVEWMERRNRRLDLPWKLAALLLVIAMLLLGGCPSSIDSEDPTQINAFGKQEIRVWEDPDRNVVCYILKGEQIDCVVVYQ